MKILQTVKKQMEYVYLLLLQMILQKLFLHPSIFSTKGLRSVQITDSVLSDL